MAPGLVLVREGGSPRRHGDYLAFALVLALPHFVCLDIFIIIRAVRSGWGRLGLVASGVGLLLLPLFLGRRFSNWADGDVLAKTCVVGL